MKKHWRTWITKFNFGWQRHKLSLSIFADVAAFTTRLCHVLCSFGFSLTPSVREDLDRGPRNAFHHPQDMWLISIKPNLHVATKQRWGNLGTSHTTYGNLVGLNPMHIGGTEYCVFLWLMKLCFLQLGRSHISRAIVEQTYGLWSDPMCYVVSRT